MGKRGRTSKAELSVVGNERNSESTDVAVDDYPKPPATMHPQAQDVWNGIVTGYPADRFPPGQLEQLETFCNTITKHRWFEAQIMECISPEPDPEDPEAEPEFDEARFHKLVDMSDKMARTAASLAVRLGLAHSTSYDKRKPPKAKSAGPKPWQE